VQRPENKFQIWSMPMEKVADAVKAIAEVLKIASE